LLCFRHGGGFESGASSSAFSELSVIQGSFYQGANLVKRSLDMGQPMIVASINYRLAHFGFTASKEFEDAGLLNLGFEDQRNALHWIQKHIAKFGGDPKKVARSRSYNTCSPAAATLKDFIMPQSPCPVDR
jgi:acetylcholinesterase